MKYFFTFLLIIAVFTPTATGQIIWTGAMSNLASVSQNWIGGPPSSNSNITFNDSGRSDILFNWYLATTSVDSVTFTNNSLNYTINSNLNSVYFRAGYIQNLNPLSVQTFNLNLELKNNATVHTEGEIRFNSDVFLQTGNGNLTFSGGGKIRLGENSSLENITNLTLSGGVDLKLESTSINIESLNISGPSIIDFSETSTFSVNSLTFSSGGSLSILNWSANDYFMVQNQVSIEDLPKITFVDIQGGAVWSNGNVTPVPEPSTYLFFAFAAGFAFLRRPKKCVD